MSNPLMASLGLETVEADPNAIPDGKYSGVVFKSEYVHHKAKGAEGDAPKDHISHVITYKVTDGGDAHGKEKADWYLIGREVRDPNTNEVVRVEPLMKETQKPWYKKRLMDLGVPEAEIATLNVESLTGLPVIFGVKNKDGFRNITFVELNTTPPEAATNPASILGSL